MTKQGLKVSSTHLRHLISSVSNLPSEDTLLRCYSWWFSRRFVDTENILNNVKVKTLISISFIFIKRIKYINIWYLTRKLCCWINII